MRGAVMALAFAVAVSSSDARSAPQERRPQPKWQVDWGEQRCTLLRRVEAEVPLTLALRIIPGSPVPELMLVNPSWKSNPLGYTEDVDVTLSPGGKPLQAKAVSVTLGVAQDRALMIEGFGEDFLDRFAAATTLKIDARRKQLAALEFSGSAKAVQALRDCNDGLMKAWGLDPQELSSLRSPPKLSDARIFKPEDYPDSSIRAGSSGTVVVVFLVNTDGRASDCKVVGPSGDPALDGKTCELMVARARFAPAVGQEGLPKPVKIVQTVHWVTHSR